MRGRVESWLCAAALLPIGTTASFAESNPQGWDPDRFATIEGSLQSYVFSETEIAAARQRLAQFSEDRSELFHALHSEAIHSLPANLRDHSSARTLIDHVFADADLQFADLDRLTEGLPAQALVISALQNYPAIEGTSFLARSIRESAGLPAWAPHVDSIEAPTKQSHPTCGSVQTLEDICSYRSPFGCKALDFVTCIKVSDAVLGFFLTLDAAIPNDIMLIVFGNGVNLPSPIKKVLGLLLYLAKVGGQIGECFLDGASECSYAQALSFLQDEQRWASDFEFNDAKQQVLAAVNSGGSQVSSQLQTLGTLTNSTLNRLAQEADYASDGELFAVASSLQSQVAGLSDLGCHLEQLARLPQSERASIPPRCESTNNSPSKAAIRRATLNSNREHDHGPEPRSIATLQLELHLLEPNRPAAISPTGAQLVEVKRLVWNTIKAHRRLAIAPSATSVAEQTTRQADRLLLAGQNQRSFEAYREAFRVLAAGD